MRYSFFSYGAFAEGQIHFSKFSNLIQSQKRAFVKGDVYRLRCGYPVLSPQAGGDLVEGTLYELDAPESFWAIFDELLGVDLVKPERSFLHRAEVDILVDNYSSVKAFTFCLNPKKTTQVVRKIEGGAWLDDMKLKPPIVENLQSRHRDYIYKLSKSKGRDIVPIKLDLYRELLSLEMIVDKGRRLALTPLGKEASLFIQ